jgi:hypothetical protein
VKALQPDDMVDPAFVILIGVGLLALSALIRRKARKLR